MTSAFSAMNSVSPICYFRTNRIFSVRPKHTTRCHRLHNRKNSLPHNSVFLLIQLHSMNLVLYKHHIFIIALFCVSRTKPIRQIPEDPSWKLMSKGERENIKAYHLERENIKSLSFRKRSLRGREILKGRERSPGGENT